MESEPIVPADSCPTSVPAGLIAANPGVVDQQRRGKPRVWESAEFEVTAYCPCEICCGEFADGVTASGQSVYGPVTHWVAADAKYPFGTCFRIPGYNEGRPVVVLDRGGAITGNKIDCYFPDHKSALRFGRQKLIVEYLTGEE